MAVAGEPVDEPLQLRERDFTEVVFAEFRQDSLVEVLSVAADRGRLVRVAGSVADHPGTRSGEPLGGGLPERGAAVPLAPATTGMMSRYPGWSRRARRNGRRSLLPYVLADRRPRW